MTRSTPTRVLPDLGSILGGTKSLRGPVRSTTEPAPPSPPRPAEHHVVEQPPAPTPTLSTLKPVSTDEPLVGSVDGGGAADGYTLSRSVYLPRTLHKNATAYARSNKTTMTVVLLDAVNTVHGELGAYFKAAAVPVMRSGDLFAVTQKRAKRAEPSVQATVRLTDEQLLVLDQLAAHYGVDRSKLVSAAGRLYLEPLMPDASWKAR